MSATRSLTRGDRPSVAAHRRALAHDNQRLKAELRASRARLVAESDAVRRRIERDLHDGAQQRFVALALHLRMARGRVDDGSEAAVLLDQSLDELAAGLSELRDLARGIYPVLLSERGLEPAVLALADRTPIPVTCSIDLPERLPAPIEAASYFMVVEALTNVVRHASANGAEIAVRCDDARVVIEVRDDGIGDADPSAGSGLRGLADRISALDGRLCIDGLAGGGTAVMALIPIR